MTMSSPSPAAAAAPPPPSRRGWTWQHRPKGTPAGAPTVVFLDDGPWISFNQMAARMRRTDCRTMRITCDRSFASRWPSLLLYNRSAVVGSWTNLPRLDDLVSGGEVVDIQCAEPLLAVAEAL